MKKIFGIITIFFFVHFTQSQLDLTHEIGVEIQAASFSTHGGTVGGAIKYALVEGEQLAFGPSFRAQYIWSKNHYLGFQGRTFVWGGGAFLHYRFLEWFFVGTEVEYLKNPYSYTMPGKKPKRWALTALVGAGMSKQFGPVRLNVGILYDLVDGFTNPQVGYNSPLSRDYFIKYTNPQKPNYGRYVPIIYRFALFIPIGKKNTSSGYNDYDDY